MITTIVNNVIMLAFPFTKAWALACSAMARLRRRPQAAWAALSSSRRARRAAVGGLFDHLTFAAARATRACASRRFPGARGKS